MPIRAFSATPEPTPGPASGRKTGNPGWYNKRFEPSRAADGNYIDWNATIRGAHGFEQK